jgi:hypothetical protein
MNVVGLELHDVDVARLPDALEVLCAEHRALTQVRTKVVNEHATNHVLLCRRAVQSSRSHYWQHRFEKCLP